MSPGRPSRWPTTRDIALFGKREILILKVLDKPGMLGDVALVIAQATINIDSIYVTTKGHVVLGVDDVDGAIQVAAGMAVMAFE